MEEIDEETLRHNWIAMVHSIRENYNERSVRCIEFEGRAWHTNTRRCHISADHRTSLVPVERSLDSIRRQREYETRDLLQLLRRHKHYRAIRTRRAAWFARDQLTFSEVHP